MSYLAEQKVIGSLIMDNDSMSQIYGTIEADMFTSELLGRMFVEFQRGYDNRYRVDAVILEQKMRSDNFPSNLILEEIKECVGRTISSVQIKESANAIVHDYKARRLDRFLSEVKVSPSNLDDQIRVIREELDVLQGEKESKSKTLAEITRENKDKYFKESDVPKMYLGFSQMDDWLGGLEGGDVTVIAARPAVGKSALAAQIATYMEKNGKRVGYYNLEMQNKQLYERFVSAESGIGMTRIRRAVRFLGDEKERFDRANEVLERQENIVITTGSKSPKQIFSESLHMGYDVIIIDYLQLLMPDKSYKGNRYAEVGDISKGVKKIAMDLNVPVILLSQLNRVSESRETKEPTMAELRESGDIEQDASNIFLLWNLSQDDRSKKGCKCDKNRQGVTGKEVLNFNGDLMRFEESDESVKEAQEWAKKVDDDCPFK